MCKGGLAFAFTLEFIWEKLYKFRVQNVSMVAAACLGVAGGLEGREEAGGGREELFIYDRCDGLLLRSVMAAQVLFLKVMIK